MGRMQILDSNGHTEITWDPVDEAESLIAATRFTHLRASGYFPFARWSGDKESVAIREFDPHVEEILWVRPLQGG